MRLIILGHEGNIEFLRPVCSGGRKLKDNYKVQIPPESTCDPDIACYKEVHGS
jgi:hypothetical protein